MLHELFVAHGSYSRMQAEESEKKNLTRVYFELTFESLQVKTIMYVFGYYVMFTSA